MALPGWPAVACISARNEERTIQGVLVAVALSRGIDAVLVVVNGSGDRTAELARAAVPGGRPRVLVREDPGPLGHDVGRAVAAEWALAEGAQTLLFLDADFVVPPSDIEPFLRAVAGGVDLALNGLSDLLAGWPGEGSVASVRRALNVFLGRPDLGLDGMVAVPHALSRRAVETVGPGTLSVPPLAYALAVLAGLRVRVVHSVNVVVPNRPSPDRPRLLEPARMAELIVGDHLEAIAAVVTRRGPRGGFADHERRRPAGLAGGGLLGAAGPRAT